MPTKHIDASSWRKIEEMTVKAVIATKLPIKEGEVLHFIIKRGIKDLKEDELRTIRNK